jgi:hypothetical protein
VIGIVERNGKVVAKVIPAVTRDSITGMIGRLAGDDGQTLGYKHDTVKHGQDEFVRGKVHTNSVEGFWALVKNGVRGVYHRVSPEYLQMYLHEYAFRYNRRFEGNQQFRAILQRVSEVSTRPSRQPF